MKQKMYQETINQKLHKKTLITIHNGVKSFRLLQESPKPLFFKATSRNCFSKSSRLLLSRFLF